MRNATKLSWNDLKVLKLFSEKLIKYPATVREIQKELHRNKIWRAKKGGGLKKWNYHDVQAQLSRLVGAECLVIINDPVPEIENQETKEYNTKPRPKYWINEDIDINEVVRRDGFLYFRLDKNKVEEYDKYE